MTVPLRRQFRIVGTDAYHPTPQAALRRGFRVKQLPSLTLDLQAAIPAGMAQIQGQLGMAGGGSPFNVPFPVGSFNPSSFDPANPSAGLLGELGFRPPPISHGIRGGMPYSNMDNPLGPGTLLGARLQGTEGGQALARWIGSHYGVHFGPTWSTITGPGGRLYGRGTPGEWTTQQQTQQQQGTGGTAGQDVGALGAGGGPEESAPPVPSHGGSAALDPATRADIHDTAGWATVGALSAAAAVATENPWVGLLVGLGAHVVLRTADWFAKHGSAGGGTKYPAGPGSPVRPGPYSPTVAGPGPGLTPLEAAALMHRLVRQGRFGPSAPWWGNQWVQERAGSGSGSTGGAGSSAEAVLLHGMKHWYDWVAGQR